MRRPRFWSTEVSYYSFRASHDDSRVVASLTSVIEFRTTERETPKAAPRNRVDFSSSPNFFRLVLKTERSWTNQITRSFLLASTDEQMRERSDYKPPPPILAKQ